MVSAVRKEIFTQEKVPILPPVSRSSSKSNFDRVSEYDVQVLQPRAVPSKNVAHNSAAVGKLWQYLRIAEEIFVQDSAPVGQVEANTSMT